MSHMRHEIGTKTGHRVVSILLIFIRRAAGPCSRALSCGDDARDPTAAECCARDRSPSSRPARGSLGFRPRAPCAESTCRGATGRCRRRWRGSNGVVSILLTFSGRGPSVVIGCAPDRGSCRRQDCPPKPEPWVWDAPIGDIPFFTPDLLPLSASSRIRQAFAWNSLICTTVVPRNIMQTVTLGSPVSTWRIVALTLALSSVGGSAQPIYPTGDPGPAKPTFEVDAPALGSSMPPNHRRSGLARSLSRVHDLDG
jgi:hypothetical protein